MSASLTRESDIAKEVDKTSSTKLLELKGQKNEIDRALDPYVGVSYKVQAGAGLLRPRHVDSAW